MWLNTNSVRKSSLPGIGSVPAANFPKRSLDSQVQKDSTNSLITSFPRCNVQNLLGSEHNRYDSSKEKLPQLQSCGAENLDGGYNAYPSHRWS